MMNMAFEAFLLSVHYDILLTHHNLLDALNWSAMNPDMYGERHSPKALLANILIA